MNNASSDYVYSSKLIIMKMFKKLFLFLPAILLSLCVVACDDDDDNTFADVKNFNELPQQAQAFLNDYFSTYNN